MLLSVNANEHYHCSIQLEWQQIFFFKCIYFSELNCLLTWDYFAFLLHDSTLWLIGPSPQMQLPFNSIISAKQAYVKHCEPGQVWRSAVLHIMHNSWDRRALICTKSVCVFDPFPIRCDKPTGAELMLLKSCTSHHMLLPNLFSRSLPLWKDKACWWT